MKGHIQVYSCYSFQNSTILIEDLCKKAKELNLEALALCDIDNMYGVMEFDKYCRKYGIKPIFGLQASILVDDVVYPFILLAINNLGYKALLKICSYINLSEQHGFPLEDLKQYSQHLYMLSSCNDGLIEGLALKEMEQLASRYIERIKDIFKDHYYIALSKHNIQHQNIINERLYDLASLHHVKVCCSNDVRYLESKDAITLELLKASVKGMKLDSDFILQTNQRYLKSDEEMRVLFNDEIMNNTYKILDTCHVEIDMNTRHLPKYPLENNIPSDKYLQRLCYVGLEKRFAGKKVPQVYIDRLNYELKVIHSMGFDDYFLIVYDYVQFAKRNKILVGPGRGSAAGSLVSYVSGITNIDPIKYDLLFERFLNPKRVTMPDIDIDFQDDRRDEVIQYITNKYGQEHVGQLVAFSSYGPRVALKDLGKVVGVSLPKLDILAKYIPTDPRNKKTVEEVYHTSHSFYSMIENEPRLKQILPSIYTVEKLPKNITMHAAGVVLSRDELDEVIPLARGAGNNVISQVSKDYIEDVGLLKMDILSLKNLTVIQYILEEIEKQYHKHIQLNDLPLNDSKTYQLLCNGDTLGVFQLESQGMTNLIKQMQPTCLEDIVGALALYRPGPMKDIPHYIARKNKEEQIDYIHEDIKDILKPTYGIMIYQEQIMQIVQKIAGFSLSKADILRKAISKKNKKEMDELQKDFIKGATQKGYNINQAKELYRVIEKFADYGFNKSHSVAYSLIAYQLAYLKANYPLAFYSAILSNEQASDTKKALYIQEAMRYGIKILPPSINYSSDRFHVENKSIRYSLKSIKNVGNAGYKTIIENREKYGLFKDIYDFMERMTRQKINSKMLESLIDAGCFDEFEYNRATIKHNLDSIQQYIELRVLNVSEPLIEYVKENGIVRLEKEKEVLGVYLSKHPLVYIKEKHHLKVCSAIQIENYIGKKVPMVLKIERVKIHVDKKGNEMSFISGYDETGKVEATVFASDWQKLKDIIIKDSVCYLEVKIQMKDKISVIVNNARNLES